MPLLLLLLLIGLLFLVIGAVQGVLARHQTNELERRLDGIERRIDELARARVAPSPKVASGPTIHVTSAADTKPDAPPPRSATATPAAPMPPAEVAVGTAMSPWPAPGPRPTTEPAVAQDTAPASVPAPSPPTATRPEPEAELATGHQPRAESTPVTPPPPPAVPSLAGVEQTIGLRWLTWIGVGLLFLGVAFLLKYAYDRDWLGRMFGPRLRIAFAAVSALLLGVLGARSLRSGMQALGQGLCGGAQGLLYLTIYAAFQPALLVVDAPLLGPTAAFALLTAGTVLGLALAVRLDALAMALLAVLGGFATPLLIQSGDDARDALCAYLLLLDLGVLGVAWYRRWRALDVLAFVATAVLFGGWWAKWQHGHPQPDATLLWLGAFHLLFLMLPLAQHWRRRTPATVERFGLLVGNVAVTLTFAAMLLRDPAPRLFAGGCLGAAALYVALGRYVARRVGGDHRTRDGFLAIAVLLLSVGLFHLLPGHAITTAWFAEAATVCWLGHRFAHPRTRLAAGAVLFAAWLRTLVVHLPHPPGDAPFLWNDWHLTHWIASLGTFVFAWLLGRHSSRGLERSIASWLGLLAALWSCAHPAGEFFRHAQGAPDAWRWLSPILLTAWWWLVGSLALLGWAARRRHREAFAAGSLPLAAAAVAVGIAYEHYAADAWPVWNGPFAAGLAALAAVLAAATMAPAVAPALRAPLAGVVQFGLTLLLTVETAAFLQRGDARPAAATLTQSLTWVWFGCAAAGTAFALIRPGRRVLALAAFPLLAAVLGAFATYATELGSRPWLANQRCLAALATSALLATQRAALRRLAPGNAADLCSAGALLLAIAYGLLESITWSQASANGSAAAAWTLWTCGATLVLAAAGSLVRSQRTGNRALAAVGLTALAPAVLLPLAVFAAEFASAWMFLNLRGVLVGAAVATAWAWARCNPRLARLRHVAFAVAFSGITLEPPAWLLEHIADEAEARRLATFAVTVTWLTTAIVLLLAGFRWQRRAWRLTALGLFVLTATKVLVIDMSGAQQVYRILAFLLVGLVFVGASWAYHRAERRFAAARDGTPPT